MEFWLCGILIGAVALTLLVMSTEPSKMDGED